MFSVLSSEVGGMSLFCALNNETDCVDIIKTLCMHFSYCQLRTDKVSFLYLLSATMQIIVFVL